LKQRQLELIPTSKTNLAKPSSKGFLKWAGGKSQLLPELLQRIPVRVTNYYEPFVGSGALYFALRASNRIENSCLSDTNEELINAYRHVQAEVGPLLKKLSEHQSLHSKEYYYEIRNLNPEEIPLIDRAARMIYLNKTCFNGLYRVNKSGRFNVPIGSYKNPKIADEDRLRSASKHLENTRIEVSDFKSIADTTRTGDFVYFDPPYIPLSKTSSFTSYTKSQFGEDEQRRLASYCDELTKRGVNWLLSNSDTELTHALWAHHKIEIVNASRAINSKASNRGQVTEVLVSSIG
jgi:DNA adenine methylase